MRNMPYIYETKMGTTGEEMCLFRRQDGIRREEIQGLSEER
jgi:hypothetical protein